MTVISKDALQKKELRLRIVQCASKSFLQQGIKGVTMDEIASSVGISKRTLYEIFSDKESLLQAIVLGKSQENRLYAEKLYNDGANVLEVILKFLEETIKILHTTNIRFFIDLKKYPHVYALLKDEREYNARVQLEAFKLGVSQGLFRSDVNFEILSVIIKEQYTILLNSDLCKQYSVVEVFESLMFTFIRGIATDKGACLLDDFIEKQKSGYINSNS